MSCLRSPPGSRWCLAAAHMSARLALLAAYPMCVCERERERERKRQSERARVSESERE
jgi:hypothetical protein